MAKAKTAVKSAASNGHHHTNGNGFFDIKELGQSLRITSQDSVELTHELARELLALPTFKGERPKRTRHVGNLLHHMQRGTFHWNFVSIVTCRCNEEHNGKAKGATFRMNGQHTCTARLEMPASYRAPVRLVKYTAATVADMRRLYATIDRNAPRTKGNVITSYIVDTDEFEQYGSYVRKLLPTGIAMWKWESHVTRAQHDGEDIAYLLLSAERATSQRVAGFIEQFSKSDYKHILRGPVVAAMFETFHKSPEQAPAFWTPVTTGLGFTNEKDPRKRLSKVLLTHGVGTGAGSFMRKQSLAPESMYRTCLVCWNAWRRGEPIQSLRLPESRPVLLK